MSVNNFKIKIALIGDYGSGKSTFYKKVLEIFAPEAKLPEDTEECDFTEFEMNVDSTTRVKVSLWDTAGMEEHNDALEGSYFRGLHGFFLMYDVQKWKSFERIEFWREQIENRSVDEVKVVLVGNKKDCSKKERVVDEFEGKKLSAKLNVPFFETCARAPSGTGGGVDEAAMALIKAIITSNMEGIRLPSTPLPATAAGSSSSSSSKAAASSSSSGGGSTKPSSPKPVTSSSQSVDLAADNGAAQGGKKKKDCC